MYILCSYSLLNHPYKGIVAMQARYHIYTALFLSSCPLYTNMPPGGFVPFLNNYFVETGTYGGQGIYQALHAGFKHIRSIEIDTKWVNHSRKRFRGNSQVQIWLGDSGKILFDVIKDIDEPITFWLDGHGADTPLLQELEQIKHHPIKTHTILIDDLHCAGGPLFGFITIDMIVAKVKEVNPNYEITYIDGGDNREYPNNIMVARVPQK